MKLLTEKQQDRLMRDLLDIYVLGSDAYKSIGTQQPIDTTQALHRQLKMIDAAMDAADIIKGTYGTTLLMTVDKCKAELEKERGFPLKLKTTD
jgi:hypothetical protein